MKYHQLQVLWDDMCFDNVGCDLDGNLMGPSTTFGATIVMLGGGRYLQGGYRDGHISGTAPAIANRDALLEMAHAIDDELPKEQQVMQA